MLRVQREGPLVVLSLDNPRRHNAQVPSLWAALAQVGQGLGPDVGAVIVRGDGPSFSAGLDRRLFDAEGVPGEPSLVELGARGAEAVEEAVAAFQQGFSVWSEVPAVTIAAVHGNAIGAGFQLALACDLRVVAADVAFAMKETSLGLVPDLGGTSPLVRQVGYARALELCATGRFLHADEAVRCGLAEVVVPAEDLDETARDLADAIIQAPPQAVRELKPLLQNASRATPSAQREAERRAQARLLTARTGGGGK